MDVSSITAGMRARERETEIERTKRSNEENLTQMIWSVCHCMHIPLTLRHEYYLPNILDSRTHSAKYLLSTQNVLHCHLEACNSQNVACMKLR